MKRILLLVVVSAGCRTVAPAVEVQPAPAPYDWKKDGGLLQHEADARCRQELPECARPFGTYSMPPSPCAGQGTRCMEVPSRFAGRWSCGCDACSSASDCKPTEHCGMVTADPCSFERTALQCLPGPPPPEPAPCLDPPASRVP